MLSEVIALHYGRMRSRVDCVIDKMAARMCVTQYILLYMAVLHVLEDNEIADEVYRCPMKLLIY